MDFTDLERALTKSPTSPKNTFGRAKARQLGSTSNGGSSPQAPSHGNMLTSSNAKLENTMRVLLASESGRSSPWLSAVLMKLAPKVELTLVPLPLNGTEELSRAQPQPKLVLLEADYEGAPLETLVSRCVRR